MSEYKSSYRLPIVVAFPLNPHLNFLLIDPAPALVPGNELEALIHKREKGAAPLITDFCSLLRPISEASMKHRLPHPVLLYVSRSWGLPLRPFRSSCLTRAKQRRLITGFCCGFRLTRRASKIFGLPFLVSSLVTLSSVEGPSSTRIVIILIWASLAYSQNYSFLL